MRTQAQPLRDKLAKEPSITARRDYSCEIIALAVLTVLSALSHFWYIMIAMCVVTAFVGTGFLLFKIIVLAKREMLARLLNPALHKNAMPKGEASVVFGRGARQSLPVA